jgi:cellulose synthase/poly-beta-1,6-N-acetylglucosamine synthase-like glycosyltransferase
MTWWQIALLATYAACSLGLMAYAGHTVVMVVLFKRRQASRRVSQAETITAFRRDASDADWPRVTTQLPIFNEADVAERLIEAVAAMDYPSGRHQIQVLDDSTDECRGIVDRVVERLRGEGVDICVVRREDRTDYKAGALRQGMALATGELLAIFDADFVPPSAFLRRSVPLIVASQEVACVQGRWDHLNREESWLTRAQSVGLEGHFVIEQAARSWNGLFMNFNGTAGLWRRSAIEAAGGWQGDTVTEDLDLSYRAQLAGYRMVYALDLACPAEIPNTVDGLKAQQRRWARGSIQTARKLLGRIWRSDERLARKVAATFHLSHYAVSVLMMTLALLTLPVLTWVPYPVSSGWLWAIWILVLSSAISPCIGYYIAGRTLGHSSFTLRNIPGLITLGSGLALNNAIAVLEGLFGDNRVFVRTPKSGSVFGKTRKSRYRSVATRFWWAEILLGLYCLAALVQYVAVEKWLIGLFLGIYTTGFLVLGWASRPRLNEKLLQVTGVFRRTRRWIARRKTVSSRVPSP